MDRKLTGVVGKSILLLALASILLISAAPGATVRLTLANQSGLPVRVTLSSSSKGTGTKSYSLSVPAGTVKSFDVVRDRYSLSVSYTEQWDPVYGSHCSSAGTQVTLDKNLRLVLNSCRATSTIKGVEKSRGGRAGGR